MKYVLLTAIMAFVFACNPSSSQSNGDARPQRGPAESPDIEIKLQGISGGQAQLIGYNAERRYLADSATVSADGTVRFQREAPYELGYYSMLIPNQAVVQLLIDLDQTMKLTASAQDVVGSMQVEGSLENELFYKSLKYEADQKPEFDAISAQLQGVAKGSPEYDQLIEQRLALGAERKAFLNTIFEAHPDNLFTKFKQAGQNPDLKDIKGPDGQVDTRAQMAVFQREFWDDVDFDDERLIRTPVIFNKLERYMTQLTVQQPDSIIDATDHLLQKVVDNEQRKEYFKFFANWITLQYEPTKTTLMDSEAVFVHMIQNYFTRERAFWSDSMNVYGLQGRAAEMAASLIGKPAPNVTSFAPDGQEKTLLDLKADYLVVYMYNPTCEHCMEQSPQLVQLYPTLKSQGVDVYAIAIDTDQEEWLGYIRKTGMTAFTNVFDPTNRSIYKKYFVDITPEVYIIGPDRKIIAKNIKVSQIQKAIQIDRNRRRG